MKRSTILITAFVFMLGTFSTVSVSFADGVDDYINHRHSNTNTESETQDEYDNAQDTEDDEYTTDEYVKDMDEDSSFNMEKDTSWFDYENPKKSYKIKTAQQLIGLASLVNENQIDSWKPTRLENFKGVTFTLIEDIELTEKWNPIGTGTASYFAGTFDGNGHTIKGLDIETDSGYAGLFGYLKGNVKNLTIEGSIVSGDGNCGGIAGQVDSDGKITNCVSMVNINGRYKTGGITGFNLGGTIERCINKGNIAGTYKVGGIVGENWAGKINQCGNTGNITSTQRGVATYGTGGVAGRSVSAEAIVSESYNSGKITSNTEATGGVVGYTNAGGSSIVSCYNTGEIVIKTNHKEVTSSWAGGVAGIAGCKGLVIRNCYASNNITGADIAGGVIGRYINDPNDPTENSIRKNYYASNWSSDGIGQYEDMKGTGEAAMGITSTALTKMATTLGASYENDASGIYGNSGYPVLTWQSPVSDDEKTYLPNISKETQIKLDKYMLQRNSEEELGGMILNIFSPESYITNSLTQFHKKNTEEE